jgi:hypothetical protein
VRVDRLCCAASQLAVCRDVIAVYRCVSSLNKSRVFAYCVPCQSTNPYARNSTLPHSLIGRDVTERSADGAKLLLQYPLAQLRSWDARNNILTLGPLPLPHRRSFVLSHLIFDIFDVLLGVACIVFVLLLLIWFYLADFGSYAEQMFQFHCARCDQIVSYLSDYIDFLQRKSMAALYVVK